MRKDTEREERLIVKYRQDGSIMRTVFGYLYIRDITFNTPLTVEFTEVW